MNKLIAALGAAIVMTAAVTAYAQNAPAQIRDKLMWCVMYPPVACTDSANITDGGDIVVKFKIVELFETLKNGI